MINTQGASRLDRSLALPVRNSDTFTAGCQPHTQTNNLYFYTCSVPSPKVPCGWCDRRAAVTRQTCGRIAHGDQYAVPE